VFTRHLFRRPAVDTAAASVESQGSLQMLEFRFERHELMVEDNKLSCEVPKTTAFLLNEFLCTTRKPLSRLNLGLLVESSQVTESFDNAVFKWCGFATAIGSFSFESATNACVLIVMAHPEY
jgi:hypothetical protein